MSHSYLYVENKLSRRAQWTGSRPQVARRGVPWRFGEQIHRVHHCLLVTTPQPPLSSSPLCTGETTNSALSSSILPPPLPSCQVQIFLFLTSEEGSSSRPLHCSLPYEQWPLGRECPALSAFPDLPREPWSPGSGLCLFPT